MSYFLVLSLPWAWGALANSGRRGWPHPSAHWDHSISASHPRSHRDAPGWWQWDRGCLQALWSKRCQRDVTACQNMSKHVKAFLKHVRAICLLPSCFEQELDSGLDSDIWNMSFSGMLWRDRRMSLDPPWWRSPDKPCPICPTPPLKTPLRVWSSVNLKHYLPFQRHSKLDSLAFGVRFPWNRMQEGHVCISST